MGNDNQSRDKSSRQQSAERSQTGSAQQGTGAQHATSQGGSYGQGQGGSAQGSAHDSDRSGTSRAQAGRGPSAGAPQRRGGSLLASPYSGYASSYGSGPFSVMRRISDEMDRLFENFGLGRGLSPDPSRHGGSGAGGYGEGMSSMWSPHIEMCERDGKLRIEADLPGMKRDDVHVRVEQDEIIIQGERRQEQSNDQSGYYHTERSYGSFYRTIPLPDGTNAESATATFKDGVLEIELDAPRSQQRGRTLEIRDGGSPQSGARAGTGSGTTYGSGTTGSMQGASQHATSGTASQHSASGTGSGQQSSGSGAPYSGSGEPSAGAAGTRGDSTRVSTDHTSGKPKGSST